MHLYTPMYNGCVLCGNNYEAPLSQLMRLYKSKLLELSKMCQFRDHITSHYVNLGLIKLPDIVNLCTCQPVYDHGNLQKVL